MSKEVSSELDTVVRILDTVTSVLGDIVATDSENKGFTEMSRKDLLLLMYGELGEVTEALRSDNPPSDKLIGFTSEEEELADLFIYLLHYIRTHNIRFSRAVKEKILHNRGRDYRHGNKLF